MPDPTPPAPRSRRGPPAPPPPTPPGPVAGSAIAPVKRDLPPGIPTHIAERIVPAVRSGIGARAPTAPEVALHPSFAGPSAEAKKLRQQAETLRSTAQNAALNLRTWAQGLKGQIEALKASPEGIAAAASEGLDLDLLSGFTTCLEHAIQITEPPTPKG